MKLKLKVINIELAYEEVDTYFLRLPRTAYEFQWKGHVLLFHKQGVEINSVELTKKFL
jgi:hypothetical protein